MILLEQVFRLPDLPTGPGLPVLSDSGFWGFRPRLRRRDRDGLAPSSLSTCVEAQRPLRCAHYVMEKELKNQLHCEKDIPASRGQNLDVGHIGSYRACRGGAQQHAIDCE